jgi:rsbT co-antagonist protein RsbR
MDTSLIFDSCCDPLVVVVGELVLEQNAAWKAAVGPASSLAACFAPEDHAAVRLALTQARSGRASLEARLAVGPRAGTSVRCTLWSAGGEERCLRIDSPAPTTVAVDRPAPATVDIASSKAKALDWIFEHIDAALWTILADGTIALSEGPALAHYGVKPGQLVGSNAFQLYPLDSQAASTAQRVLAGEVVRDAYAEDDVYWLEHCHPLREEGGEVLAMIGLVIGMTENAREMLNGQNLLRIVNELPMIVWAMTADGTCTLSAGKSLTQFGFAPGELVGKNMFEVYADNPASLEEYRRVLAGEHFTTQQTVDDSTWSTTYRTSSHGTGYVTGVFAITEDVTERTRSEERILDQLSQIQAQKEAIDRLVSPIIEVWRGVLVVPLFGEVSVDRTEIVTERLLQGVVQHRARFAILDLTGIENVDASTAQRLFNIMRGVDLLGCTALISGIQPNVARTMTTLGVDIPRGRTHATLADALQRCLRALGAS